MADYAKGNFLEDIPAPDLPPGIPEAIRESVFSRFSRSHLGLRDIGVSYFRYAPGFRSPMAHSHREQEEAYVVVEGSGEAKLDDETVELRLWDVVRVAPEVVRAFAAGPEGLTLIAVGGPKPEGGDGVLAPQGWSW
jgi:mannose-6-phosphate isomerase-like protein (cupin superfamily)